MTQLEATPVSQTDRITRPIFLSGLRKSGTSMSRMLFDGHPSTFTYPRNEMHFFRYTDSPHITSNRKPCVGTMRERIELLCSDKWFSNTIRGFDGTIFKENMFKRLDAGQVNSDRELLEAILCSAVRASSYYEGQPIDQLRVVVKGVHQAEFFPELLAWYPDIKFIYVLRNPYGQLNSAIHNMRHNQMGRDELNRIANDHKKLHKKLPYPFLGQRLLEMRLSYYFMRKWSKLYPEHFKILVYDRLLADPEAELRPLAEWIGIDYDPCLQQVTRDHGNPMGREGWSVGGSHKKGEISTAPMTAWKEQMPDGVQMLVGKLFHDVISEFGFEARRPQVSKWKKFDKAEDWRTFAANRFLFSKAAARMLGPQIPMKGPQNQD